MRRDSMNHTGRPVHQLADDAVELIEQGWPPDPAIKQVTRGYSFTARRAVRLLVLERTQVRPPGEES
jgi:hypothetical protein